MRKEESSSSTNYYIHSHSHIRSIYILIKEKVTLEENNIIININKYYSAPWENTLLIYKKK